MARNPNGFMTGHALTAVVACRSFAARHRMWIVAGGAGELACALQKARGFSQPVCLVHDLKLIVEPSSWRMVEVNHIGTERLTRFVRECLTVESPQHLWQFRTRRFEVALHADLKLAFAAEP